VGYDVLAKGDVNSWRAVENSGIQKLNGYKVEGITAPVNYTVGDQRLSKSLKIFRINSGNITAIGDWVNAPYIKYEDFSWFPKS
jgi:branched-chain amino acid transport system substrate-binding protein